GRYETGPGVLEGLRARVFLPQVGSVDIAGRAEFGAEPSFDLTAEAGLSLGPAYSLYTEAGVSEEARTRIEGKLEADLRLRKSGEGLSAGGRVRLSDTNIERPGTETFILGLEADLPLLYESSLSRREGGAHWDRSPERRPRRSPPTPRSRSRAGCASGSSAIPS
ncbi:MAG: hypothetical protein JW775_07300, partial [Candidatus Aminicenantes bacterium]|nr:hypothetical protein [Candidatus Aminicenantes bacterium]